MSGPGNELLQAVEAANYREWGRPPGREARLPTTAPHGRGVEIFLNPVMAEALANADGKGLTAWPNGAIVVLEGYAVATAPEHPDGAEPLQVAIMQKQNNVWYWEQYQAEDWSQPRFSGRPDVCLGCHINNHDYLRSTVLPKPIEMD